MAGGVNTNCRSGNYPNKVDVMISPSVLEKMASDPKEAKKYEKMLADIPQCEKWANAMIKSMTGNEVKYRQVWIDENGNMGSFSISGPSEKQKQIDQKRRENEQEKFEERLEKAREKRKQLEEKTAEVNEKIAISEGTQDENNTAKDKAERLLLEKLENATHGEVYFDNEEMQMILNAAKEETQEQGDKVKNPVVAGNNFDMQI